VLKTAHTYQLGTYARFYSLDEARALILLLDSNDIPYKITRERNQLDDLIIGGGPEPMIILSIPPDKFQEVNLLVEDSVDGIAPEQENDITAPVTTTPERLKIVWIILGYILCLFPLIGLFVGITLSNSTRRLPDGSKIKMYDNHTIMHGRIMIVAGIIRTLIWIGRKVYAFMLS
jgi:hypothetical protein